MTTAIFFMVAGALVAGIGRLPAAITLVIGSLGLLRFGTTGFFLFRVVCIAMAATRPRQVRRSCDEQAEEHKCANAVFHNLVAKIA